MGEKVLVVEDDADIVELLELYLTGSGYEVLSAGDGVAALELARTHPVDVALVDIMMPRMNGYDFIKELRRESSVPVIVVSARPTGGQDRGARRRGGRLHCQAVRSA